LSKPFLTLYTPAYKRPQALARCFASVAEQTAVKDIEQIVIPDHVGIGVHGMYAQVPNYAEAVHGEYVCFLCDDDVLAGPTVVEQVKAFAEANGNPPLILVATQKGPHLWPAGNPWPPNFGAIDLNCGIVRSDIWKRHAGSYGHTYEGDYTFLKALYDDGIPAQWCDVVFSHGAVSRGMAETI
jgi:glycosyltransferase involved in cell wall biosynthesis